MVSDKKRLHIALYASGFNVVDNEPRYHWAFLVGPKSEDDLRVPGKRYHVKNDLEGWVYEEANVVNVKWTPNLLARIIVAKVKNEKRLIKIFRRVPVVQNDPNWRCRSWVSDVLAELKTDRRAVGTSQLDWTRIEALARGYVRAKTAAGRYLQAEGVVLDLPRPTWDMLEGKEVIA